MSNLEQKEMELEKAAKQIFWDYLLNAEPSNDLDCLRTIAKMLHDVALCSGSVGYVRFLKAYDLSERMFGLAEYMEKLTRMKSALRDFLEIPE